MKTLCQHDNGKCTQCGTPMGANWRRPCVPGKQWPTPQPNPPATPGLGDRIESTLIAFGITKESYIAFKQKCGLPPTCNCDGRKEGINNAEEWMNNLAAELGSAAANAISKIWAPTTWFKKQKPENEPPKLP